MFCSRLGIVLLMGTTIDKLQISHFVGLESCHFLNAGIGLLFPSGLNKADNTHQQILNISMLGSVTLFINRANAGTTTQPVSEGPSDS